jgi:hypothetical protein
MEPSCSQVLQDCRRFESIIRLAAHSTDSAIGISHAQHCSRTKVCMILMDNTLTSVLAALSGSVIGASTPVLSNFVLQRSVAQRELTNREIAQREELYSEFIRQGTAYYAKALSQSLENIEEIEEIVAMYALVNRIRLFASRSVLDAAEAFVKRLVAKYGEKNMTIEQITSVALEQHADPLNDFALKCRAELRDVYARGSWRSK